MGSGEGGIYAYRLDIFRATRTPYPVARPATSYPYTPEPRNTMESHVYVYHMRDIYIYIYTSWRSAHLSTLRVITLLSSVYVKLTFHLLPTLKKM